MLHAVAGDLLEGFGHLLHAEQEHRQATQQRHSHLPPVHFLRFGGGGRRQYGHRGQSGGYTQHQH